MISYKKFLEIMQQTRVVRFPRHTLATFGASEIQYRLITSLPSQGPAESKLRTGLVVASRPKILTREALSSRFQGFEVSTDEFETWLKETHQDAPRALEYDFRNRLESTLSQAMDARELAEKIQKDLDRSEAARVAVITAPEAGWQFALLKFIVEETLRSFRANVRELDERGLFDPAQTALNKRRREIESLFQSARRDPSDLRLLGQKLKEYGLIEEYQDRFFNLVRPSQA